MRQVGVVGVGMIPFGRYPDRAVPDLGREAVLAALADYGGDPRRIGAAYCGSVYSGMMTGQRILRDLGLTGRPVTNVENACSSGSTAFRQAYLAIAHGEVDVALAMGVERLSRLGGGTIPLDEDDWNVQQGFVMPAIYALRARRYLDQYGWGVEALADVAVKNRGHAAHNPYAQFRDPVTREQVLASRPVAEPLTLMQCCPTGDGAAAAVLCALDAAGGGPRPVRVLASALTSGRLETGPDDITVAEITVRTAAEAYRQAGLGPDDLSLAELHDAFTISELMYYEALGLCRPGEAPRLLRDGVTRLGGRRPVNPSGGLLAKGHPLGATGMAQIVESVWQLRGAAGPRQVDGARVALTHCTGGGISGLDHGACTIHILAA